MKSLSRLRFVFCSITERKRAAPLQAAQKTPKGDLVRSAPETEYHANAATVLETVGDQELPDVTLSDAQRTELKSEVLRLETRHTSHELIFLSSALEVAANRKRAEELRRA
jgi:hypothetical protein